MAPSNEKTPGSLTMSAGASANNALPVKYTNQAKDASPGISFSFGFSEVRVIRENGVPWFVARDVCEILDISNSRDAFASLEEDEKGVVITDTPGGQQTLSTVSESGLYSLIFRSRKPEAQKFRKWVTSEVLPKIRQTGGYIPAETNEDEAVIMARAVQIMQATIERQKAHELEAMPKIALAEAITAAPDEILVGTLAKIIQQATGHDIGEKRLYRYFRENGFVCATPHRWNVPTQRSIEQGLLRIKEEPYISINGRRHVSTVTMVTPKGQAYFIDHFRKLAEALQTASEEV